MTVKKILKILAVLLLAGLLIAGGYVQYVKSRFDRVYAERESLKQYEALFRSGALGVFKDFVINNIDTILTKYPNASIVDRISISGFFDLTRDTLVSNSIREIRSYRIFYLYLRKDKKNQLKYIKLKKKYLHYKVTPTYHCLIYYLSEELNKRCPKEIDYWCVFSYDDNEHDFGHFMDFRPEWSLPYFEAFDFFEYESGGL